MKGTTNNPNGRPAGTPNKSTKEIRAVLKVVITEQIEDISTLLEQLPAQERLELIIKLMPYVLPKVESAPMTEIEIDWLWS